MKHISEILDEERDRLMAGSECDEDASSADPYVFDVVCQRCGFVFDTREPWCPQCEDTRAEELPIA